MILDQAHKNALHDWCLENHSRLLEEVRKIYGKVERHWEVWIEEFLRYLREKDIPCQVDKNWNNGNTRSILAKCGFAIFLPEGAPV